MKKNIFTIGAISALFLVGCTGFNQDPLKDKPAPIQHAKPPDNKIDPARPFPIDSVKIVDGTGEALADKVVAYKEGETKTIPLKVKTYLTGYTYTMTVLNADEFKGSTFDPKTGNFTWTPTVGIVTDPEGLQQFVLNVWLVAEPNDKTGGKATLSGSVGVNIWVQDRQTRPVVKNVDLGPSPSVFIEEGTVRNLSVTVEDLGTLSGATANTKLMLTGNLAEHAKVTSVRAVPGTQNWIFDLAINLIGKEITRGVSAGHLEIRAESLGGFLSVPYSTLDFTVLTQRGLPVVEFPANYTFTAGVENAVPFMMYDSYNESVVSIVDKIGLPLGAQINCETALRPFRQCIFTWTPSETDKGKFFTTLLRLELKNADPIDMRQPVTANKTIDYKVAP